MKFLYDVIYDPIVKSFMLDHSFHSLYLSGSQVQFNRRFIHLSLIIRMYFPKPNLGPKCQNCWFHMKSKFFSHVSEEVWWPLKCITFVYAISVVMKRNIVHLMLAFIHVFLICSVASYLGASLHLWYLQYVSSEAELLWLWLQYNTC